MTAPRRDGGDLRGKNPRSMAAGTGTSRRVGAALRSLPSGTTGDPLGLAGESFPHRRPGGAFGRPVRLEAIGTGSFRAAH